MKRTNTTLLSIVTVVAAMAIAAGPAAAVPGRGDPPAQPTQAGHSSINAILGSQTPAGSATASSEPLRTHPGSLSAIVGPQAAPDSINAILGPQTAPEQPVSVVEASSGFNWGDAFIGAGVAVALVLLSGVTFYEVRRHGRVTVARA
jgi:hypothetical protein